MEKEGRREGGREGGEVFLVNSTASMPSFSGLSVGCICCIAGRVLIVPTHHVMTTITTRALPLRSEEEEEEEEEEQVEEKKERRGKEEKGENQYTHAYSWLKSLGACVRSICMNFFVIETGAE